MQRAGKTYRAGSDGGLHMVDMRHVMQVVRGCQLALEQQGEEDSATYFEILGDYLEQDVVGRGKPLQYNDKMLGL